MATAATLGRWEEGWREGRGQDSVVRVNTEGSVASAYFGALVLRHEGKVKREICMHELVSYIIPRDLQ